MNRRAFTTALLALLAACGRRRPPGLASTVPLEPVQDARQLGILLERERAAAGLPALAGMIVRLDDEIAAAVGVREAGGEEAVTAQDPWHIGSDTKAMTAALVARLVEAGQLGWGATIPQLFPALPVHDAWKLVTIEQLLGHTAGLGEVGNRWLLARRADARPLPMQRLDTAAQALAAAPEGAPGAFRYSNLGYIIAGAAIENATGRSWEEEIEARVFQPLGMKGAGFGPPPGAAPRGHRTGLAGGRLISMGDGADADNPPALGPAGTVHLPLQSWARFVRVFLDPAPTFLRSDSIRHLLRPPGPGRDYALGWILVDDPQGGRILAHSGSNTFWYASAIVAPEHGLAVLLATNAGSPAASAAIEALGPALAVAGPAQRRSSTATTMPTRSDPGGLPAEGRQRCSPRP